MVFSGSSEDGYEEAWLVSFSGCPEHNPQKVCGLCFPENRPEQKPIGNRQYNAIQ